MKKIIVQMLTVGILLLAGCAGVIQKGFMEPTSENTMIIIGSILIEDNYYTRDPDVYRARIEVAVFGKTEEGKIFAYWTHSDEKGYFSICDVPKARYALKGFRVLLKDGTYVTVTNRLNYVSDNYLVAENELVIFEGNYFAVEPLGRIINMQHNHFILTQMSKGSRIVNHNMYYNISKQKLVNGESYSAGPVVDYIMKKHPDSQWIQELELVK